MLLFSSALIKHKLTFTKLSDCMGYITIAANWAESEWGYIRNKGVKYREGVMSALSDNIYIGTFAGQPVGMFALLDHSYHNELVKNANKLPNVGELMYVYVEKNYRGFGFGKQIIQEAKRLSALFHMDMILLDTLKPNLNKFYEKHGATVICEGKLFSHSTDVLRINI